VRYGKTAVVQAKPTPAPKQDAAMDPFPTFDEAAFAREDERKARQQQIMAGLSPKAQATAYPLTLITATRRMADFSPIDMVGKYIIGAMAFAFLLFPFFSFSAASATPC
jgi:hypothetical protein